MTHYIPPFTRRQADDSQEAVCGRWVVASTPEPTCPECQAWIQADADTLDVLVRWSKARDAEQAAGREPRR